MTDPTDGGTPADPAPIDPTPPTAASADPAPADPTPPVAGRQSDELATTGASSAHHEIADPANPDPVDLPSLSSDGAEPAPRRSRRLLVIGGIAVAVVIVAIVAIVLVVTAGPSNTPQQAAEGYFTALTNGDVTASENFVCDADKDPTANDPADDSNDLSTLRGQIHFTVGDVAVNGKQATATVTLTVAGPDGPVSSDAIPVPLVQEHGAWKVCFS